MEIQETKNKVKIKFEYSKKLGINFAQIGSEDLNKINIKIWLNNGEVIFPNEIKTITLNKKDEEVKQDA